MTAPIACVLCLIGPDAQQMVVPMAQAAVVVAPIVLRDRIRQGVGAVRSLRARRELAPEAGGTTDRTARHDPR